MCKLLEGREPALFTLISSSHSPWPNSSPLGAQHPGQGYIKVEPSAQPRLFQQLPASDHHCMKSGPVPTQGLLTMLISLQPCTLRLRSPFHPHHSPQMWCRGRWNFLSIPVLRLYPDFSSDMALSVQLGPSPIRQGILFVSSTQSRVFRVKKPSNLPGSSSILSTGLE